MITINNPDTAIKLTPEQAKKIGIVDIKADKQHGELETRGPWNIPMSYKAICMAANFAEFPVRKTKVEIYGMRTLSSPKQSGYCLEGRVSIGGKKYTAFTSDQLFDIEGHLISVATIHARKDV